jgi:hypothetical protein
MKSPKKRKARRRAAPKKTARRKPTEITIRRSSGRKEKFDRERLASTTSRSGVPFLMARDIAKKVTKQVRKESRGKTRKTVTGGRIRKIVGGELRNRNPNIASTYDGGSPQVPGKGSHLPKPTIGNADTDQHSTYRADLDSIMHDKSKRLTSPG